MALRLSAFRPLQSLSVSRRLFATTARRYAGADKADAAPVNPKIQTIVDSIGTLTLLETASLVKELKSQLNIKEVAVSVAAAPAAAAPAAGAGGAATAAEAPKAAEKKEFTVKLEKFDPATKAKLIKEIKAAMPGFNLVEAKKFVESAPKVIKESVPKEEAVKLQKALEAVGATVSLE